jgi:hypothetical protein
MGDVRLVLHCSVLPQGWPGPCEPLYATVQRLWYGTSVQGAAAMASTHALAPAGSYVYPICVASVFAEVYCAVYDARQSAMVHSWSF